MAAVGRVRWPTDSSASNLLFAKLNITEHSKQLSNRKTVKQKLAAFRARASIEETNCKRSSDVNLAPSARFRLLFKMIISL